MHILTSADVLVQKRVYPACVLDRAMVFSVQNKCRSHPVAGHYQLFLQKAPNSNQPQFRVTKHVGYCYLCVAIICDPFRQVQASFRVAWVD